MQELSPCCHGKKGWGLNANLSDRLAEKTPPKFKDENKPKKGFKIKS